MPSTADLNPRTALRPLSDLRPHPDNPRRGNVAAIEESLRINGQYAPIVALPDGTVLAGSHRLEAARRLGWSEMLVTTVDADDEAARRIVLADNRTGDLATYDSTALADLLSSLETIDGTGYGEDDVAALLAAVSISDPMPAGSGVALPAGDPPSPAEPRPSISDRFLIPPFSILDARGGPWLARKRQWLALGIRSEEGRAGATGGSPESLARAQAGLQSPISGASLTLPSLSGRIPTYYAQKEEAEARLGRLLSNEEFEEHHLVVPDGAGLTAIGTSVFDPVLCELTYRWYSAPGARILDPFAGGSVRGVVASMLGRSYVGVDLREEQTAANRAQARDIVPDASPVWLTGDSREILSGNDSALSEPFDLVFSCPPYADLERYSDDPADISTMPYDEFLDAYREIIALAIDRLADDRFACFVVGEVRDKRTGIYRNFVGDTVEAFTAAGASFYNESILQTPVASLAVRITKQFTSGRKVGKCHQNVLVFVKGDGRRAAEACGEIIIESPEILGLPSGEDLEP